MAEHLLHTRVKTAKGRKKSSTAWLQRQLNDPYVVRAKKEGYRGRAAYKIIELNEQFHFFKKGYSWGDGNNNYERKYFLQGV